MGRFVYKTKVGVFHFTTDLIVLNFFSRTCKDDLLKSDAYLLAPSHENSQMFCANAI